MNRLIKRTVLIAIILISSFSYAQITVSFNVSPRPTPQISEWENRNELAILTITNTNSSEVGTQYKIKAKVFLDSKLIAETRLQDMPIMELPFGTETYLADMIIPYNALEIYDAEAQKETIIRTGLLPAGVYSFCITLVDLQGNILNSTQEVCRQMIITDYQMPELIYPIENINIPSNMALSIIFRWTPLSPPPSGQDGVKYLIAVTKIQPGQTSSQAFLSNYSSIEEEVIGSNQFYFPMDVDLSDTEKTRFVWSVKPMMLDDTPYNNQNNGFVALGEFSIGEGDTQYPILDIPVMDLVNDDEGELDDNDIIHAGLNGEFDVLTTDLNESEGKYSGKGTVYVDWLKARINVVFNDITVNTDKRLLTGKIIAEKYQEAPEYPQEWALEAGLNNPWVNNVASSLVDWVETSGVNIPYNSLEDYTTPVKVPLGVNLESGDQIAITEMVFEPNKSEINVITAKNTPPNWGEEQLIGFKASGIDFRPNTISSGANRFELIENVLVNTNDNLSLKFKKGTVDSTSNPGCYIEFENAEFQEVGLEVDATLSRNWLVPFEDDGTNTIINLSAVASDWDDMILTGSLPKSKINGCGGLAIKANEITYDMSDTKNASNVVFPDDYVEITDLYRGFFAKNVQITLPETWEVNNGVPSDIGVHNLIIDNLGISLKATVNNVFEFKEVSVADLTASVTKFEFEIVTNDLVEAAVSGKLALPLSDPDATENPLLYNAIFQIAHNESQTDNVQLTINPGSVNVDLLKGTMNLNNTSNITAYIDKNKKKFDLTLNGSYIWDNVNLGSTIGEVDMEMDFEGIKMHYDTSSTDEELTFNTGTWSFASPAKKMSGFPITIEEISYRRLPGAGALLRGSLDFDVVVNLSENIGGRTTLGIESSIHDLSDDGKFRFTPKFDRVNISAAEVHADTPAVKIDGLLNFRQGDDEVYGRGFMSTIAVKFKPVSIGAEALVEFGKTDYLNNGVDYRYWRVEALVEPPPPGIVFLPGLAFVGFGGGAYKNMEPKINDAGSKYVFTPKKGGWGLKAKTRIATTPKETIFNADADLLGHFSGSNGLERIGFEGTFKMGSGDEEDEGAQVTGDLLADYDIHQKHFQFGATINYENDKIKATNVGFHFDINGRTNKWFFKFGEPENLNTITLKGLGDVHEYLMVGNDIPTPHGFSDQFISNYAAVLGHNPTYSIGSGGVDINSTTGKGFAFGANFAFDSSGEQLIWRGSSNRPRKLFVYYDVNAGAELNLSLLQYRGSCAGYNPMGINGWRADGGLGLYAEAKVGVKAFKKNGNEYDWSPFDIANLKVGAWVQGQFPRPSYVAGRLEGHVNTVIKNVNFDVGFHTGQQCNSGTVDLGVGVEQQDATDDLENELIMYVNPNQNRNIPINSPLVVKYAFKPNEVIEIAEQQADGTVVMRSFKMTVTNEFKGYNKETEMMEIIPFQTEQNNLGEYLITVTTNQEPYYVPSEMLEGITDTQDVTDIEPLNIPLGVGDFDVMVSNSDTDSSSTVYTTSFPVITNVVMYQIPSGSLFGNGVGVGSGVGGGIPNIGNAYGFGPNYSLDEELHNRWLEQTNQPIKTMRINSVPARQNRLAYNTLYSLETTAKLREYKNGNWNTIVFSSTNIKEFWTEKRTTTQTSSTKQ